MKPVRNIIGMSLSAATLILPTIASACGNPSEKWYREASDIIFDADATCKPDERTCRFRVNEVIKNPLHLEVERRPIDIDYYSWRDDFYKKNPNTIVIVCGVPEFKPDEERISGRFYANIHKDKNELVIRRYVSAEDSRD